MTHTVSKMFSSRQARQISAARLALRLLLP
jgi:hypothetical protein